MATHVVNEARRCLHCKVPQCRKGCPIQTNIPEVIDLFLHNQLNNAGELLFENNPLSVICSLVCDHEKQCEGHCVLGRKGVPVHFSSIEHYISDSYLDRMQLEAAERKNQKVAIVGSGPAGMTISILLAQRGYCVTLFESREKIGGILRYGIPDFRLPKIILDRYKQKMIDLGIKIRPNRPIARATTVDDLQRDGYQAIFIGTGVWRPKKLGIRGETLGHVHYAIDYLVNPDVYDLGNTLAVIGAGNAAMDVARTALRKGVRHVMVLVRSTHAAASSREIDYAVADGVEFRYGIRPEEITDEGILYRQAQFKEDGSIASLSERKLLPADNIIVSISQDPQSRLVTSTEGIAVNERGLLATDEHGSTTREGIFASGDAVRGAKTVVEAVSYSKRVADEMDAYLQSLRGQPANPVMD